MGIRKMNTKKVCILTNTPSPYRIPLWSALSKVVSLRVICFSLKEKNRQWNISLPSFVSFLPSFHFFYYKTDLALHLSFPSNLFVKLLILNPDIILVTGYDNMQFWEALIFKKIFHKKIILWNGSTVLSSRNNNRLIIAMKRFFVKQMDAFYSYGSKATEYLVHYGADSIKITTGANTVDTYFFKRNTSNAVSNTDEVKKILFVGQLIRRKGIIFFIRSLLYVKDIPWLFTIVGSGPLEKKLMVLTNTLGLSERIEFVGYKDEEAKMKYYADADIFVMPSLKEVWGLVINEALASGLFCLSSKYAGVTYDLIRDGENGFIIDPLDIKGMSEIIKLALNSTINKKTIKSTINITPQTEAKKIYSIFNKVSE